MKTKALTIQCSHCKGAGVVELNGVFADTLRFLRTQSEPVNATDLARLCGIKPTAMNNRLAWPEAHGLAKSERYGRERRFKAK